MKDGGRMDATVPCSVGTRDQGHARHVRPREREVPPTHVWPVGGAEPSRAERTKHLHSGQREAPECLPHRVRLRQGPHGGGRRAGDSAKQRRPHRGHRVARGRGGASAAPVTRGAEVAVATGTPTPPLRRSDPTGEGGRGAGAWGQPGWGRRRQSLRQVNAVIGTRSPRSEPQRRESRDSGGHPQQQDSRQPKSRSHPSVRPRMEGQTGPLCATE